MSKRKRISVAVAMMVVLLAISIPTYKAAIVRSRESVLRANLAAMRQTIKQFTQDAQRPPQALRELVDGGYFRAELPIDPITNSASTWKPVIGTVVTATGDTKRGITDVRSGSDLVSSSGATYGRW